LFEIVAHKILTPKPKNFPRRRRTDFGSRKANIAKFRREPFFIDSWKYYFENEPSKLQNARAAFVFLRGLLYLYKL